MSDEKPNPMDILRQRPVPKRIGPSVPSVDAQSPAIQMSIVVNLTPEFIEMAVRNALLSGVDKSVILKLLYRLDDVIERLIRELEE